MRESKITLASMWRAFNVEDVHAIGMGQRRGSAARSRGNDGTYMEARVTRIKLQEVAQSM